MPSRKFRLDAFDNWEHVNTDIDQPEYKPKDVDSSVSIELYEPTGSMEKPFAAYHDGSFSNEWPTQNFADFPPPSFSSRKRERMARYFFASMFGSLLTLTIMHFAGVITF
jgi:hypothetical protein